MPIESNSNQTSFVVALVLTTQATCAGKRAALKRWQETRQSSNDSAAVAESIEQAAEQSKAHAAAEAERREHRQAPVQWRQLQQNCLMAVIQLIIACVHRVIYFANMCLAGG